MLIDAFEHLDGLPARLGLLASSKHLQADKSLSSRVATAYDSPDLNVQQAGNIRYQGQTSILLGGCAKLQGWPMCSRGGQDAADRMTATSSSGTSLVAPHPVRVKQVCHGGALCQ